MFKRHNWIKDFYFKAPARRRQKECEQPLLSSQIINGSVTQNKSAKMETTRMRKLAEYCAKAAGKGRTGISTSFPSMQTEEEEISKGSKNV